MGKNLYHKYDLFGAPTQKEAEYRIVTEYLVGTYTHSFYLSWAPHSGICKTYCSCCQWSETPFFFPGPVRCHCTQEMWSKNANNQNNHNQDSVCVTVALGDSTEAHGHVYTTIAGMTRYYTLCLQEKARKSYEILSVKRKTRLEGVLCTTTFNG